MKPADVIWRIIERLEESKAMLDATLAELHPRRDKELIDAITEVEQLTQTQLNICRRAERRISRQ